MLGADWTLGSTTVGLVAAHSRGEGEYRSPPGDGEYRPPSGDGEIETTLVGLYPWGRHELNDRLSVWGVAGYGAGTLTLTPPDEMPAITTDTDLAMAALGGRGVLRKAPKAGGLELAALSDVLIVRTSMDGVRGSAGSLAAVKADVTRLRLGFEGAWHGIGTGGGSIVPALELGVRYDGGDAETGLGVDIGAGFIWTDPD